MPKDVRGQWDLYQIGPGEHIVTIAIDIPKKADLEDLRGNASYPGANGTIVAGAVTDTNFWIEVKWNESSTGAYHGSFGLDNRLSGITMGYLCPWNHRALE
jgi:hypothetical protein